MSPALTCAVRTAAFIALLLGLPACDMLQPSETSTAEGEHGAAEEEYERGSHRGRMLRDGNFAVEITIFEDGVDPQFRVYPYKDNKPIEPSQVELAIELERLGHKADHFLFTPQDDYLMGDGVVTEPHSFAVTVQARYNGKMSEWRYDSFEGRTTIAAAQAEAAGIEVEAAGPATLAETVTLTGHVDLQPQGRAEIKAWFPGRIIEMTKAIGDRVESGERLARITANESLQTYTITAPISGVIMERYANVGEVAGDTPLYLIADVKQVHAEFFVFPAHIAWLAPGMPVMVHTLADVRWAQSEIEFILPQTDQRTQTGVAHVELPNPDEVWKPGEVVEGEVTIDTFDVPLAVRTKALQPFRDFTVVYARVGEIYEVRMLELGRKTPEWTEVLGGLEPGEVYVTENAFLIRQDIEKDGASHDH